MTFKKWMVGLVLALVMVFALGMNALLFSARDFQYGLAKLDERGAGLIVFERALEADARITALEDSTGTQRQELADVEAQLAALASESAATLAEIGETRVAVAGAVAEIEARADVAAAESAAANLEAGALDRRVTALASRSGLAPEDQRTLASLRGQVTRLAQLEEELDERDTAVRELETRRRQLGGQVGDSIQQINALKHSVVLNVDNYDRVIGEVRALKQVSPLGIGAFLAQGHPAFISTLLVLLMGALGAILYLFPAYMSRPEPVLFSEIGVRLIFGMCTALAFYVIANATLAGFSITPGATQASTAAGLNPFTVSLIGIVAGVMADDIARWIKNRGAEVLGAAPATPLSAPSAGAASDFTGPNPHGGPNTP